MAEMKQKIRKKRKHPIKRMLSIFVVMIASFLTYLSALEFITTLQLQQEISETKSELTELQARQASLEEQKAQFEDPEYVKRYARGKYLLSKEGETIYKFQPDAQESE